MYRSDPSTHRWMTDIRHSASGKMWLVMTYSEYEIILCSFENAQISLVFRIKAVRFIQLILACIKDVV